MTATFILQGLTPKNHVSAVAEVMRVGGLERTLISVAFVSSGGVELLADHIRPQAAKTTVFVGVRNSITSAQAIKALLDIKVDLRAVDTGSPRLVFHPKLYYARGRTTARLLVGSANLTTGGLNNNVEASLIVDLDLSSERDSNLAQSIENLFDELPTKHPDNISTFPKGVSLAALLADPRLVDERTAAARTVSRLTGGAGDLNPVPLLKMLTERIFRLLPKRAPAPARPSGASKPSPTVPTVAPLAASYEPLWTAPNLTQRDLSIPKGANTNPTGSVNLDKGGMEDGFEFQSYFRDEVFKHLSWDPPDARKIEVAQANFRLVVGGIECGEFSLIIRHDTKTDTASHKQNNAMTKLSWGSAKPYVAKDALIGRTLRLSRAVGDPAKFLIEID